MLNAVANTLQISSYHLATCMEVLICINIMQLDDESFNLWNTFNSTFAF